MIGCSLPGRLRQLAGEFLYFCSLYVWLAWFLKHEVNGEAASLLPFRFSNFKPRRESDQLCYLCLMESFIQNYLAHRDTLVYMNIALRMYHSCKGVARDAGNDVVCCCLQQS